jgi:Mrp family chromosome partitioning ATPase
VQPAKGRWIKLVRIPGPHMATYVTYQQEARYLALWQDFTLITTDDPAIPRVQFGEQVLRKVQEEARRRNYRVIVIDAPTGLALH